MIKAINAVYLSKGATNVRSWHGADKLTEVKVCCERKAEVEAGPKYRLFSKARQHLR